MRGHHSEAPVTPISHDIVLNESTVFTLVIPVSVGDLYGRIARCFGACRQWENAVAAGDILRVFRLYCVYSETGLAVYLSSVSLVINAEIHNRNLRI